jgi:hypothetical protein
MLSKSRNPTTPIAIAKNAVGLEKTIKETLK